MVSLSVISSYQWSQRYSNIQLAFIQSKTTVSYTVVLLIFGCRIKYRPSSLGLIILFWTTHLHYPISCTKVRPTITEALASFVRMYVHWADHFIHRLNGIMSLLVNGLLVFVIHDDKKTKMGDYRYLIITFAIINVISTITDNLVPIVWVRIRKFWDVFISVCSRSQIRVLGVHRRRILRKGSQ